MTIPDRSAYIEQRVVEERTRIRQQIDGQMRLALAGDAGAVEYVVGCLERFLYLIEHPEPETGPLCGFAPGEDEYWRRRLGFSLEWDELNQMSVGDKERQ